MLENGFGEHDIQGIGDKHIPLIHNVMATDVVTAVSDQATDRLDLACNSPAGRRYLADRRKVPTGTLEALSSLGLSSLCNVLASIKVAKHFGLGPDDVILTVATDGASMYGSVRERTVTTKFGGVFDEVAAAETVGQHLFGQTDDHLLELTHVDRTRIFNLGYFTWVEQQGVSLEDFVARRDQAFWVGLRELVPAWDAMIEEFNGRTGVLAGLGT
jgi:hypothetical protein